VVCLLPVLENDALRDRKEFAVRMVFPRRLAKVACLPASLPACLPARQCQLQRSTGAIKLSPTKPSVVRSD
jgi:hypothetical protein